MALKLLPAHWTLPPKAARLLLPVYVLIFGAVLWIRRSAPWGGTIEDRVEFSWLWAGLFLGLILIYVLIYGHIKAVPVPMIVAAYLVISAILLLAPVLFSSDIYIYAMRGRVLGIYHQNPYLVPAANFPDDPFLPLTDPGWRVLPQNYGPLWTLISAALARLGAGHIPGTIFLFKLLGLAGSSLGLALVHRIAKKLRPDRARAIVGLYALNPLLLAEFVNNGHNDVWMVVFGLLALYFYLTRKDLGIVPALVLGGLIKYSFWLLVPLFLAFLWREKRLSPKLAVSSGLLAGALLAAGYLPFWRWPETLAGLLDQSGVQLAYTHYTPVLLMLFLAAMARRWPLGVLKSGLAASRAVFLAAYVKILVSARALVPAIVLILAAFAFLGTATVYPWYILWWLPFLMIQDRGRSVILWSCVGLGSYLFLYSTTLSLALIGGAALVFISIHKELGRNGADP